MGCRATHGGKLARKREVVRFLEGFGGRHVAPALL